MTAMVGLLRKGEQHRKRVRAAAQAALAKALAKEHRLLVRFRCGGPVRESPRMLGEAARACGLKPQSAREEPCYRSGDSLVMLTVTGRRLTTSLEPMRRVRGVLSVEWQT